MAEEHARRFIDALHRLEEERDLETMIALYADGAELRNPTDGKPHRGPEGARAFWDAYRHSFGQIHSDFRTVTQAEGAVMLEWTSRGTMAGGTPVQYDGVSVVEYEGDRIRRFRAYFDPNDLGEQVVEARR